MLYYLKRIHHKLTKLIDVIFNVLFIIIYDLYNSCRKKYLARKRNQHAKDDPTYQHFINIEKDMDIDRDNIIHEFKVDGKESLPMTKTNSLINQKNKIRRWCTTFVISIIYLYLCYHLLHMIYFMLVKYNKVEDIQLTTTQKDNNNTHWYYASLGLKKYKTFDVLKSQYYTTIMQPCRPLTKEEIDTNLLSNARDSFEIDLSLIYHILCHVATDQVIENSNMNVIIPKYLNVSQIRRVDNESPIDLMNDDIAISLETLELPNICVMAIAMPKDKKDDHDHDHWEFEKKIDKNIPSGSFIHSSVSHVINETISHYSLNPITKSTVQQMWKSLPIAGECAILINPDIAQKNTDDEKYTITHTSNMLEEDKLFDSHLIKDIEIKYTALDQTHKHWIPSGRKESIFVQVANNILYSKNCLDESHD
jgi:hypothetical protein